MIHIFFIFVGCWAKQFSFFENLYYNTGFDKIIITLANQNGGPFEMGDKVNLTFSNK